MKKWIKRLILWPLLLLLVVVILALVFIDPIATKVTNSQLAKLCPAGAKVDKVDVQLFDGRVTVHGLEMKQPEGFGEGDAVRVKKAGAAVKVGSLFGDRIEVKDVVVDGLRLAVAVDSDGAMNLASLTGAPPPAPAPAPATPTNAPTLAPTNEVAATAAPPGTNAAESASTAPGFDKQIHIGSVRVTDAEVSYADESVADEPYRLEVRKIGVAADNLLVNPLDEGTPPGDLSLDLEILQPDEKPPARAFVRARVADLPAAAPNHKTGENMPLMNGAFRLIGFDLDTVGPFTAGGENVIGAADVAANFSTSPTGVVARVEIHTPQEVDLEHPVEGAWEDIDYNILKSALGNGLGIAVSAVGAVAGNAAEAVEQAGETVVAGATNLAKGAVDTVGSVFSGLGNAVGGVLEGDVGAVGEGLKEATVGTVETAADAVVTTGEGLVEGVGEVGEGALGMNRTQAWWAKVDERYKDDLARVEAWVEQQPIPPEAWNNHQHLAKLIDLDESPEKPEADATTESGTNTTESATNGTDSATDGEAKPKPEE